MEECEHFVASNILSAPLFPWDGVTPPKARSTHDHDDEWASGEESYAFQWWWRLEQHGVVRRDEAESAKQKDGTTKIHPPSIQLIKSIEVAN